MWQGLLQEGHGYGQSVVVVPGAVILGAADLASARVLVGCRGGEDASHPGCVARPGTSIRELRLLPAAGRNAHHQKKAMEANWAGVPTTLSLLFVPNRVDTLLVPWPF